MDDPFTPKEGYGQVLYKAVMDYPKVIRLDEHRVLKKLVVGPHEAAAMRFIAANTTIPVPKVYNERESDHGMYELVMEHVPGTSLDKTWTKLTHDQKLATCRQLKDYLSQLQNIKGTRIQNVSGGPITVGLRFPTDGGPFDTEKEFNDWMVSNAQTNFTITKMYAMSALTDNHEIRFAHGDFSPRNIMVDETGKVTAVLDWDRSGWYPEYWDTTRMLTENAGIQDYYAYIHHIIPVTYTQEYLALRYMLSLTGDM